MTTQRIGYSKVGRSWNLDPEKWSAIGGDMDVGRLLQRLAAMYPDDEIWLLGRNSGEDPQSVGYPPNVKQFWTKERLAEFKERAAESRKGKMAPEGRVAIVGIYDDMTMDAFRSMDQQVVWAGQHGTSNSPLPQIGKDWNSLTNPQDSALLYSSFILRGINAWRYPDGKREEVWLCPDPRNYVKARDLKWPLRHPVLAQYEQTRQMKYERYGDLRSPQSLGFKARHQSTLWVAKGSYVYSALELTMLPEPDEIKLNETPGDVPFGMIVNENRGYVADSRSEILKEWVLPHWPDAEIHGKWSPKSLEELGLDIKPIPIPDMWERLRAFRTTFTTPASGSRWATGKPWEAFATGTICFFHPKYDSQGHIIPTREQVNKGRVKDDELAALARWLRPQTPEELRKGVDAVMASDDTWQWLAGAQRRHFEKRFSERRIEGMIASRFKENEDA